MASGHEATHPRPAAPLRRVFFETLASLSMLRRRNAAPGEDPDEASDLEQTDEESLFSSEELSPGTGVETAAETRLAEVRAFAAWALGRWEEIHTIFGRQPASPPTSVRRNVAGGQSRLCVPARSARDSIRGSLGPPRGSTAPVWGGSTSAARGNCESARGSIVPSQRGSLALTRSSIAHTQGEKGSGASDTARSYGSAVGTPGFFAPDPRTTAAHPTFTAGSARPSLVAGAGTKRGSSAPNQRVNFKEGLRGSTAGAARKSVVVGGSETPLPVLGAADFTAGLSEAGFVGNAMTIFTAIIKERVGGGRTNARAGGTISVAQLRLFKRSRIVVLASFAEALRRRRGSVLRSWRLDVDLAGRGFATSEDLARMRKSLGVEPAFSWDCLQAEGGRLEFGDVDLVDFRELVAFAEALMAHCGWDAEVAWELLDEEKKGYTTPARVSRVSEDTGFRGHARHLAEGLDISGQGRLWRDDFEYMWLLVLPTWKQQRDPLTTAPGRSAESHFAVCGAEPSEEHLARWLAQNVGFTGMQNFFKVKGKDRRWAPEHFARELERLGFDGDSAAASLAVAKAWQPDEDADLLVSEVHYKAFHVRWSAVFLSAFNVYLTQRRGSALRAWRLDLDLYGTGLVGMVDFQKACRQMGRSIDGACVWDATHADGDVRKHLTFHELNPAEGDDLQSFAEAMLQAGSFSMSNCWSLLEAERGNCANLEELTAITRSGRVDWHGQLGRLHAGIASGSNGEIWPEDLDYACVLAFLRLRTEWQEVPLYLGEVPPSGPAFARALILRLGMSERGLRPSGERMTQALLRTTLERLEYRGAVLHAAHQFVWKILTGEDLDPTLSAKGIWGRQFETQANWDDSFVEAQRFFQMQQKSCRFDGDVTEERRRRLHAWHRRNGAQGQAASGPPDTERSSARRAQRAEGGRARVLGRARS